MASQVKRCLFCAEAIADAARKCKHFSEFLDGGQRPRAVAYQQASTPKWSPGVAAVLSLVILGAGQMYKGQVTRGLIWLVIVLIGYAAFVVPGLASHFVCILGAASGNPMK